MYTLIIGGVLCFTHVVIGITCRGYLLTGGLNMKTFNEFGEEICNSEPMAIPLKFQRPTTIQEDIKRFIRAELSQQAEANSYETFEESDDFEVEDDIDFYSPYEFNEAEPMEFERGTGVNDARDASTDPPVGPAKQTDGPVSSGEAAQPSTDSAN